MIEAFEFVDGDRTFTCSVEKTHSLGAEKWWWFRVSTDRHNKYAPFRADAKDTQKSVKARIVAYYDALLHARAQPAPSYWRRGAPVKPEAGKPGAPAPAAAVAAK